MRLKPTCWNLPPSLLWPDTPPPSSSSSLCSHLHQLQHVPTKPLLRRNLLLFPPSFISFSPSSFLCIVKDRTVSGSQSGK